MRRSVTIHIQREVIFRTPHEVSQLLLAKHRLDAAMAEGMAAHGEQSRRVLLRVLIFAEWTFELLHSIPTF
jgi:hypothetical protein